MRLLLLTDGLFPFALGGMQKHSSILIRKFQKAGIDLTVVHCGGEDYSSDKFIQEFGGEVKEIFVPFIDRSKLPGHYLRASKKYAKSIAERIDVKTFDLIYAQGFSGYELAKLNDRPPLLLNLHGLEMYQGQSNLKSKIDSKRLKKIATENIKNADYVYSFGGHINKILEDLRIDPKRILLQMNGISADWIRTEELPLRKCSRFIFIGREERRKGILELNQAIKTLSASGKEFTIDFVGPISKSLDQFKEVVYHGVIKDKTKLTELLDRSDCLICPSYSEGMPTVIAEAMARGCAIIATDVGAVSRQFDENGVLLEQPEPNMISKAMSDLMDLSESEFLELRQRSIEKAKASFTWEKIAQNKIEQFNSILAAKTI